MHEDLKGNEQLAFLPWREQLEYSLMVVAGKIPAEGRKEGRKEGTSKKDWRTYRILQDTFIPFSSEFWKVMSFSSSIYHRCHPFGTQFVSSPGELDISVVHPSEANYAHIQFDHQGPALLEVHTTSDATPTTLQEEYLHAALYASLGFKDYPGVLDYFSEMVVHATHASLLMDRVLTQAAVATNTLSYWQEKAQEAEDQAAMKRRGVGVITGTPLNRRFFDTSTSLERIGGDLAVLEDYFTDLLEYGGVNEFNRFMFETVALGFGNHHKDWTYDMIDRIDTSSSDWGAIGEALVKEWGIPMLEMVKGTAQQEEVLTHLTPLTETPKQSYFCKQIPTDYLYLYNRQPEEVMNLTNIGSILSQMATSLRDKIVTLFLSPTRSPNQNRELQRLLEQVGLTYREVQEMAKSPMGQPIIASILPSRQPVPLNGNRGCLELFSLNQLTRESVPASF